MSTHTEMNPMRVVLAACDTAQNRLVETELEGAIAAINDSNMALFDEISRFAIHNCPNVKSPFPWARLACKRMIGLKRLRFMQPSLRFAKAAVIHNIKVRGHTYK